MAPEERQEVADLLEFGETTAAGRMNTEFLALDANATVNDAIEALRHFEGGVESVSTIFLVDQQGRLIGTVPLARLVLAKSYEKLSTQAQEPLVFVHAGASEKQVAEIFDKYNLLTLPVLDAEGKLTGVITSDDVISLLRAKL
jgi:Mg/Co/Ni transporter MgtE